MAKVIHKGIKEDGTIDAEVISTPVQITQLIGKFPKMCEADICNALREIRESAEQDERIRKIYAKALKDRNHKGKEILPPSEEKKLINRGVEAVKRCVKNHDIASAYAILKLCKAIAGDRFTVELM